MKTPRCKYPCVSLGTTGSSLPSGIRCACPLLNPVPSINITCYEMKLSPGNTACQCKGGGGVQRHQPGCRWKPHLHMECTCREPNRGTQTNAGIHGQKQRRRHKGDFSLAQKRSPPESLEIARREAPQLVRYTHPRPCF